MALHAIHDPFNDGMVLGKPELTMNIQVALETCGWIFARVHDETTASAANANVLTGGAVA